MNFSVIYNPISTKFSQAALEHLISTFSNKGWTLRTVAKSEYAGHAIELIKTLDPISDYLITLGGDGTVNEAVRAFHQINQHSVYAHISTGTTNDMANNFNLSRKDPISAINKLAAEGEVTQMDSILVNGESVCYVSAFGYVAPIPFLVSTQMKKRLGHAAYVVSALPILARRPEKLTFTYTANGETKEITSCLALITTSKGMGGINLYTDSDQNDGKFEVFFLHMLSPRLVAEIFPHYLTDTIDIKKYTKYSTCFSTDRLTIRFDHALPKYAVDNDGNKASFDLTPENNVLEYALGRKINVLMPLK